MTRPVLRTKLCDILDIEYPIMLAGMGVWGMGTPPELVAAVSEAGGLGVLGGSALSPEEVRRRIQRVRQMTDKPFGVDLLLPKIEVVHGRQIMIIQMVLSMSLFK